MAAIYETLNVRVDTDLTTGTDDNTLMLQVRDGDEEAFYQLVARYKNLMVNYVYRMVGDHETAVELAQEIFLRVYRSADRYDHHQKFSTWIYKIASNLAIDEIRRKKRRRDTPLPNDSLPEHVPASQSAHLQYGLTPGTDPEAHILQNEVQKQVFQAIQALPPEQKQIFILKEIEQASLEEISGITGIKIGTLKSRLFRARQFLQGHLNGYFSRGFRS